MGYAFHLFKTSMIFFAENLNFEAVDFFDVKYLGNVGKELTEFGIKNKISTKTIKNFDNINWNDDFDTFILGHIKKIEFMLPQLHNYTNRIISKCLKYKKNLFLFEKDFITPEIEREFEKNNVCLYYPEITQANIPIDTVGKLYMSCIPSIAVFGTSSKQGKFTLQLNLRKEFIKNNYKVGQIGTEPSSLLFGFDYVYPLGYNSHNSLTGHDSILALNNFLMKIETEKEPDIIIIGSQSHTVPININNISNIPIYQQDILYAIKPDICLLCVNISDEIEYIEKNIMFLESIANSKVLALIISPIKNIYRWTTIGNEIISNSKESIRKFKRKCSNLKIPIYEINECHDLFEHIINYLSE